MIGAIFYTLLITAILMSIPTYFMLECEKYNKEWDLKLNELLDKDIDKIKGYVLTIDGVDIWIYSIVGYGKLYNTDLTPSLKTRYKLNKKIKAYKKKLDYDKLLSI